MNLPPPLSKDAIIIQKKINAPLQKRKYVGYNRKFLESYKPNETSYLTQSMKKKLMELGKTDGDRPSGTYAKQIYNRLIIDLSWNSSRLEGNTYSLLETQTLLEYGKTAQGKDLKETQMILNHKAAIEFLIDSSQEIGINRFTILNLHALLSNNLISNPRSCGSLRQIQVCIAKTVYQPLAIPQLIEECFNELITIGNKIKNPFEQAFFLMVQIPYLQPFEDVNKRVSRLAANIPLFKKNLSPLSFIDVNDKDYIDGLLGIYELNKIDLLRDIFLWAYERSSSLYAASCQSLGNPDLFKMKYRNLIAEIISQIVLNKLNKNDALLLIKNYSNKIHFSKVKDRFIEVVEFELINLHEGNIARYHLNLKDFQAWKKNWC